MNYNQLSREELIRLLQRRDNEQEYGLVWERNEIEHEKSLSEDFVSFNLQTDLCIGHEPWDNLLIEGENLDALRALSMTHKGKIKVIYIDPPYNTGNKDFIYNDKYIDKEDAYRHSKWLEFMYRRLLLAKDLLSTDGLILLSIGEDEFANLSLLMEKIFPGRKVGTFVWMKRQSPNSDPDYFFSQNHEYVLCYANEKFTFGGIPKDLSGYSNPDNDPRGPWTSGDLTLGFSSQQRPNLFYPITNPENGVIYPCNPDRVWVYASENRIKPGQKIRKKTMEDFIRDNKVLFPVNDQVIIYEKLEDLVEAIKNRTAPEMLRLDVEQLDLSEFLGKPIGFGRPMFKRHVKDLNRSEKPLSSWIVPASEKKPDLPNNVETIRSGMTSEGTKLIQQIMGSKAFSYPKPLSLIKSLIAQTTLPNNEDIILDFFAGSGTTGQAVLELNEEDDGNRRFILVSSSERTEKEPNKNICRDVTQIRLKSVIEGYSFKSKSGIKEVEALGSGMAYLTMDTTPIESLGLKLSHEAVWINLQLLHFKKIIPFNNDKHYHYSLVGEDGIGYVSNLNEEVISTIKKQGESLRNITIYSWSPGFLKQRIFSANIIIEKLPDFLINKFGGD
ncbi:site-specific DNA-methyltransferase [Gottfriedia acidiceleris]|uniref:site-specific DNA-methyltransferase n=1 Tax=Gottfriedia acidiceleris TaxID=371036 RepID=UPI0030009A72